jgi:hypothetical protein
VGKTDGTQYPGVVDIQIVPGNIAPHYGNAKSLEVSKVIVTERGTKAEMPIVDFVFVERDDSLRVYSCTGKIVQGIASVISGVVNKNHPDPNVRTKATQIAQAVATLAGATQIPAWAIDAIEYALEQGGEK